MTDANVTEVEGTALEMGIDPFERNWIRISILLLVTFFATVSISGFALGFQVSGAESEVDPRTVLDSAPWSEPGVREVAPGEYEAYVVARLWLFDPITIEVPVGSKVTIYVTSPDLQHGFKITDTNVNMQVVPARCQSWSTRSTRSANTHTYALNSAAGATPRCSARSRSSTIRPRRPTMSQRIASGGMP